MKLHQINPFSANSEIPLQSFPPASFLQTPFWGEFKAAHGWKPLYFILEEFKTNQDAPIFLTVLVRHFSRFASIAYVPMGPDLPCDDPVQQGLLLQQITSLLTAYIPQNTLCVRFDPPWGIEIQNNTSSENNEEGSQTDVKALGLCFPVLPSKPVRKAPSHIQPPDTVILDLTKSPEILLSEMKSKWRYNIKLGEKKGVTIRYLENEEGANEGINIFYRLYIETAKRDGIALHSKEYYEDLVRRSGNAECMSPFNKKTSVRVYIAEHEGTPLASIITLFCGDEAIYLYGASSNEKRNLMPAYSLQWKSIRDAQAAFCKKYDFYGIPPTNNPSHPMYGLYRFKTGFGGSIVHRVGSLDIPLRPFLYTFYRIAEAVRNFWYKRVVKLLKGEILRKS